MNTFQEFLAWEHASRDTIDFKRAYADVAGDVLAGLVLSELVYWHLPKQDGTSRLRVQRDNEWWIACPRAEWWSRVRMTPRQIDGALALLVEAGLIVKALYKWRGAPTIHVRVNQAVFLERLTEVVHGDNRRFYKTVKRASISRNSENRISQNSDMDITKLGNPYTETTGTETLPQTTKTTGGDTRLMRHANTNRMQNSILTSRKPNWRPRPTR
jgi:hypothetical protein